MKLTAVWYSSKTCGRQKETRYGFSTNAKEFATICMRYKSSRTHRDSPPIGWIKLLDYDLTLYFSDGAFQNAEITKTHSFLGSIEDTIEAFVPLDSEKIIEYLSVMQSFINEKMPEVKYYFREFLQQKF